MNFDYSGDQHVLRGAARELFAKAGYPASVRRLRSPDTGGHDPELFRQVAGLGWTGLALPEDLGGGGGTMIDLAALLDEAGRALVPRTLSATVAAGLAIDRCGSQAQRAALLPDLAQGHKVVAPAIIGRGGPVPDRNPTVENPTVENPTVENPTVENPTVEIARGPSGTRLAATALVPHATVADWLLVVVRRAPSPGPEPEPDRSIVALLPRDTPGITCETPSGLGTEGLCLTRFDGVLVEDGLVLRGPDPDGANRPEPPAARPGGAGPGGSGLGGGSATAALEILGALFAVEAAGGATAVLDMTVAYTKERVQFDRPIGSFQAVQHQVADCAMAVDAARYAALQAVWALDRFGRAPTEVSIATVAATDAFKRATLMAHELHGGAGYVTDHDLHLYSERAQTGALLLGSRDDHLALLAGQPQPAG